MIELLAHATLTLCGTSRMSSILTERFLRRALIVSALAGRSFLACSHGELAALNWQIGFGPRELGPLLSVCSSR